MCIWIKGLKQYHTDDRFKLKTNCKITKMINHMHPYKYFIVWNRIKNKKKWMFYYTDYDNDNEDYIDDLPLNFITGMK